MGMFRGASDSAGKCILNLLKVFNLCEKKSVVKKVAIVKTKVDEESGDSGGSGKVKSVTDATEVTCGNDRCYKWRKFVWKKIS